MGIGWRAGATGWRGFDGYFAWIGRDVGLGWWHRFFGCMGSLALRGWGSFLCVEWAVVWDRGSSINLSVSGHLRRRLMVVYGRHRTTTHVGSDFFAWRFSAGDGRCGFTGGMMLAHLVWGLLLHGIGTFVGVIHGIYVTRCDYLHRLGWAA